MYKKPIIPLTAINQITFNRLKSKFKKKIKDYIQNVNSVLPIETQKSTKSTIKPLKIK